ncbi:MAG: phosphodiester glycosidase family protein [Clostridia bacterium]|nr:phosphodiester glycosidase family protein [Clostridia bacterium]
MNKNGEPRFKALRMIATILANLTAILSANYIVFYILDHFNPGFHFVVRSEFFLTKYLHVVIPILMVLTALLYLLVYTAGGAKLKRFNKARLIRILVIDVILAGAFAMTVNARAFGWVKWLRPKEEAPVAIATRVPTAEPTQAPTAEPTAEPVETPAPDHTETAAPAPNEPTAEPTPEPTPEPTTIPGLLGDKFKEKFSEGEPVVTEPNTSETLADGTEKTLIYTYAGQKVAVELYHYQKGKLEYQIADLYVRDIEKLAAVYENDQDNAKYLPDFAESSNAIIAINSDYFSNNATDAGLIIRNGMKIRDKQCKHSDLLVIYQDGTARCFDCKQDKIDNNEILSSYPYHSFYFGPSLLDADGNAKTKFNSTLMPSNPRTAFGYYEPGHYAFIVVLGDRGMKDYEGDSHGDGKSPGMTLTELSALCASLGMKVAYNFDGGGSSGMCWNKTIFGHNSRTTGDILAIVD